MHVIEWSPLILVGLVWIFLANPFTKSPSEDQNKVDECEGTPFHVLHHPAAPSSGYYLPESAFFTTSPHAEDSVVVQFQPRSTGWRGSQKRA